MSKIGRIRNLVQNGLFYLTEHAYHESQADAFDIYDIEFGFMTGKIRRSWPRESKFEVVGNALDSRRIGIICRITMGNKVRVITVYEDQPK